MGILERVATGACLGEPVEEQGGTYHNRVWAQCYRSRWALEEQGDISQQGVGPGATESSHRADRNQGNIEKSLHLNWVLEYGTNTLRLG